MAKIKLTKPLSVVGKDVTEVEINPEKLSGNDLVAAETEVRAMGEHAPSVFVSMRYQAILAGKLIGVPVDDIMSLPAIDFRNVTYEVASFLLN